MDIVLCKQAMVKDNKTWDWAQDNSQASDWSKFQILFESNQLDKGI